MRNAIERWTFVLYLWEEAAYKAERADPKSTQAQEKEMGLIRLNVRFARA
jgi:hypothetical protein